MVKAVFDEFLKLKPEPKTHFTVGINDDVTGLSLKVDSHFDIEPEDVRSAVFFGLGSDGTVSANKNLIKIIGEEEGRFAQAYFVYDSKKSGAQTVSHLRFGPRPIRAPYLIRKAQFVACHHFPFIEHLDVLEVAALGAVFLLNTAYSPDEVWAHLPLRVQSEIWEKKIRFYVIDAQAAASEAGMGRRINTIMETCFFALSGVMAKEKAISKIKAGIEKTYAKSGEETIRRNFAAVDAALDRLREVAIPQNEPKSGRDFPKAVPPAAPDFVRRVTGVMIEGKGDLLPVSAFPVDGAWPLGTSRWEKRNLAMEIPVWDEELCIQCNKCAFVCPHAAIRAGLYEPERLIGAPALFKSADFKSNELRGLKYTIQVAPEDCTGCGLCVEVCPAKDKAHLEKKAIMMTPQVSLLEPERENYRFFLNLPEFDRSKIKPDVKGSQFFLPLFEYSGACAGCGEAPYIKLLTQLFSDRLLIANATGCSSIYGGNLPTTPYTVNSAGRGPAWSNSLFEDDAEFGLGFRMGVDVRSSRARSLLAGLETSLSPGLARSLLDAEQSNESEILAQRARVLELRSRLENLSGDFPRELGRTADYLVRKSVWIVGGDGWAYDIGFGGLDHVLSLGQNVKVLVLDTEVYSNTGGQQSKATPLGAEAKFASKGKSRPKKDLGLMLMSYGNIYIASVAFGAKDSQTVKAFLDAESYAGPAIIIAYSPCIAHGYDLRMGTQHQKLAVDSWIWPLYRFDPRLEALGKPPLQIDSSAPKIKARDLMKLEMRFADIQRTDPERFERMAEAEDHAATERFSLYRQLSGVTEG